MLTRHAAAALPALLPHCAAFASASKGKAFVKTGSWAPVGSKRKAQAGDQTPRQEAVVTMLMALRKEELLAGPSGAKAQQLPNELQSAAAHHQKHHYARTDAWMRDMRAKCLLQRDALRVLSSELRVQAMQPDYTPYPPARNFFFDTPPTAYLGDRASAAAQQSGKQAGMTGHTNAD